MTDCIFCKIAAGEIPCTKVYEDERFLAFRDLSPVADTHVLIIPKRHITGVASVTPEEEQQGLNGIFSVARTIAETEGIAERGFRLVVNTGHDGGQTVPHFHLHVIGGKELGWPPFAD